MRVRTGSACSRQICRETIDNSAKLKPVGEINVLNAAGNSQLMLHLTRNNDAEAEGHQGQSRTMNACRKKMQHVLFKRSQSGFRATLSQT